MLHLCPLSKRGETLFCTCRTIGPYLCLSVSLESKESKCCTLNNSKSLWLILTKLGTLAFSTFKVCDPIDIVSYVVKDPWKTLVCIQSTVWLTSYDLSLSLIHWLFSLMPYIFIFQSYNGGDKVMKSYQFWNKKIRRKYLCIWIAKTVKWLRH